VSLVFVLGIVIPPVQSLGVTLSLTTLAEQFFTQYGVVLNAALLLLLAGLMGAQYLVEDA